MNASNENSDDRTAKKRSRSAAGKRVCVVKTVEGTWELRDPRCAKARREDLEEVIEMVAAGENEIAQDELRWLLSECRDFIAAHKLLGDLAVATGDWRLARGHFGYAYQLGLTALDAAGNIQSLPYENSANRPFFEAGRGLIESLLQLKKQKLARDVVTRLQQLDSTDSLKLHELLGNLGNNNQEQNSRRDRHKKRFHRRQ